MLQESRSRQKKKNLDVNAGTKKHNYAYFIISNLNKTITPSIKHVHVPKRLVLVVFEAINECVM